MYNKKNCGNCFAVQYRFLLCFVLVIDVASLNSMSLKFNFTLKNVYRCKEILIGYFKSGELCDRRGKGGMRITKL